MDPGFEHYDTLKLDEALGHFYMDVRKSDGNRYKTNSLQCLRYSMNRYLKAPPYNKKIDIVNDERFSASRENFKAAMAELKRMGLGDVEHYPSIAEVFKPKHLSTTQQGNSTQSFNESLQGVNLNELFNDFTETSVNINRTTLCPQVFNNCSVTIVYKRELLNF